MSPLIVLLIVVAAFILAMLIEIPVGVSLAMAGSAGIFLLEGYDVVASVLASIPYSSVSSYLLFAIPMFILLGSLVSHSQIADKVFAAAYILIGWVPGGLAVATAAATAIFSGISGSSAADVATMGRISIGQMRKYGYRPEYASAVVAAAGAFAALIPPSVGLVIYGLLAKESIGAMLMAGIIPGALSGAVLMVYLGFRRTGSSTVRVSEPAKAVTAVKAGERSARVRLSPPVLNAETGRSESRVRTLCIGLGTSGLLFVLVAGGIYSGVFTATEAGAVGAFVALMFALTLTLPNWRSAVRVLREAASEAAQLTAMIFLLLFGGAILAYLVTISNLAPTLSEWISALPIHPKFVLVLILLALLPLGMVLDGLSILLLVVPLLAPVVTSLGFNGIWFGILVMKVIEIGLITPPVGINCYIIAGIVPDVAPERVFRAVAPFVLLDIGVTAVLFSFPDITTWLPQVAGL